MTIGIMAALHGEIAELIQLISEQPDSTVQRVGLRDFYVGQLDGQACVVVLAGVDEELLVAFAQRRRNRGRLDELRAVAKHRRDAHQRSWDAIRSRTSSAISRVRGPGAS